MPIFTKLKFFLSFIDKLQIIKTFHKKTANGEGVMASVYDVAKYILRQKGPMTTVKLHKLVYYCQAWSLVWDDEPMFDDQVQAWANGPVVPNLFWSHKGRFKISEHDLSLGDPSVLNGNQKETINSVLEYYGDKNSQWLVDLTHMEDPWKEARGSCPPGERCDNEIPLASMHEYYSGL